MLIKRQKDAAEMIGVTSTALRQWMAEPGFPDCSAGYDVAAIRDWQSKRVKKGAADGDKLYAVKLARQVQGLRKDKVAAERAEREEELERGNILPRDEYTLSVREIIQLAALRFESLPKLLCRHVRKPDRQTLREEGTKDVRKILAEMARGLEQLERDDKKQ